MTNQVLIEADKARPPMHPPWLVAWGNFFFRYRNGLFPIIFLILMALIRPAPFLGSPSWDQVAMLVGTLIALTGQGLRLFVIGFAYIRRGGRKGKVHADELVVAGLYAHSRNPMYVGNFLIACGLSICYGSAWMYGLVIPLFAWIYLAITAAEEQFLLGKFGPAYEDYVRRVNRFVPDVRGLSQTLAGYPFRWREVLSKEYGTLFATLAGLTAIAMWKEYWLSGWDAGREDILALAWLFLPWTLFYVLVRYLKMTGRLKEPAITPAQSSHQ